MSATCAICPSCNQPIPPPHGITVDGTKVIFNGRAFRLTGRQADFFAALLRRIGRTVSKESLMNELYGLSLEPPDIKIVDVLVSHLRRHRLKGSGLVIKTEWGRGYRLEHPAQKQLSCPDTVEEAKRQGAVA